MLYLVPFLITCLGLLSLITQNKSKRLLFHLAVLFLIVFCALRDAFLYPDIQNYYDYFKYGYTEYDLQDQFNYGYGLLNTICALFTSSFQPLLIVISFITVSFYSRAIKEYSPYLFLSLILYVLINYYPSFFLLRQYLAMGVFLHSLKYVIDRKFFHFGICLLISLSFHTTAIIALPVYFLYGIKNTRLNMLLLLIGAIAIIILFFSFSTYIAMFSAYYAHYFEVEMEESAWKRAIMKVFIFGVYMFIMRKHYYDIGINRIVFYCMVLNVVICIAAMNVMGVFRLREYFSLSDFIGIPIMIKEAKSLKNINRFVGLSFVAVYVVLLFLSFDGFINSVNMNNAYRFYWENNSIM